MVEHILMWRTVKNEDKNREQFRCLHDLLDFYTITSDFTRFEWLLHDYMLIIKYLRKNIKNH
jgi:hypothetical protein